MEEVNCLFCKEKKEKVFWEENGYLGRKCEKCEVIFISPRPNKEEMDKLYEHGMAGGADAKKHAAYSFYKDLMAKHTLGIIKKFKQKGDILEVGAGGGQFLRMSEKYGFSPFGAEINKEQADFISKKFMIEVENKPAEDEEMFGLKKFDVIYHKDLLSHLREPVKSFNNFYKKLRPDGTLIFETGNNAGLSMPWLNFLGRMSYPEHLYFFSEKSVRSLLDMAGFKIVKKYIYSIVLARLIAKLLRAPKTMSKNTQNIIKDKPAKNKNLNKGTSFVKKIVSYFMFFLTYRLGKILPKSWPSTIIYVAVKK